MKICILAAKIDTTGGGGRHLQNIITALRNAGHTVTMVPYSGKFWRYVLEARRHAKNADIVQVIDMRHLAFAGFIATRYTRARFVVTTQGTYAVAPLYNSKTALVARYIYRSADAVVAISSYTASLIRKKVPGLKITIIDPGIDMTNFAKVGEHTVSRDRPLILGVGSVKARKGYDVSLRAFASLKKDIPGMRYTIVGPQTDEPEYVRSLKELARELGIAKDVELLANVTDAELDKLYAEASAFVLTSVNEGFHFEGYGMVFLEAAAHGVPSVGTRGNGIEDAVEDGKTGMLVAQRDVEGTARAIQTILMDQGLQARMSARAREFAREHDLENLMRRYEDLYRAILVS